MARIISIFITVTFAAAGPAMAADGLTLTSFKSGTPAYAASVNVNFGQLEQAIPVMWASVDQLDLAGSFAASVTNVIINELQSIIVPDPGILVINGSVFINNDMPAPRAFTLNPLINGSPAGGHSFQALFEASPDGSPGGEGFTLSYSYAAAVMATTYDVSQEIAILGGAAPFTFNKNNLVVFFYPNLPGGMPIADPDNPPGAWEDEPQPAGDLIP